MVKERFEWVDQLRFIGIIAVILGHIASPFSSFIYSWHMPLFFMISGFFIDHGINKSVLPVVRKDFKRLMIPYFIFSFLGLAIEWIKRIILKREDLDFVHEVGSILFRMDYQSLQNHYGFVLWFLPALFISKTLYLIILRLPLIDWLNGASVVLLMFWVSFKVKLPFEIDVALNAMFWLFLGSVVFGLTKKKIGKIQFSCILFLTGMFLFVFGIPQLNLSEKYYSLVLSNVLWVLLLVGLLVSFLKSVNRTHVPSWSKETMFLMVFHPYTNNIAHLLVERFMPGAWLPKLVISLGMLQLLLLVKSKTGKVGILKYV